MLLAGNSSWISCILLQWRTKTNRSLTKTLVGNLIKNIFVHSVFKLSILVILEKINDQIISKWWLFWLIVVVLIADYKWIYVYTASQYKSTFLNSFIMKPVVVRQRVCRKCWRSRDVLVIGQHVLQDELSSPLGWLQVFQSFFHLIGHVSRDCITDEPQTLDQLQYIAAHLGVWGPHRYNTHTYM